MSLPAKIFVIMPYKDEFFQMYETLKIKLGEKYTFTHAEEEGNQQNILKDVIQPIYDADLILADLTGLNPNVLYELGIAHTLNKKTIIITKDDVAQLPFDLKQYRAKNYGDHFLKFEEMIKYVETTIEGAITNTITFSNPVTDFLSTSGIKEINLQSEPNKINITSIESKGFLDYVADLEEDTQQLTAEIADMTSDLGELTNGMNKSTDEINKVKEIGGNGTASFIRKEARKVGTYVERFGSKLQKHNSEYSILWYKIENNINGLLENEYSLKDENKESMIAYIKSLYKMKDSLKNSISSTQSLKNSMLGNKNLERSLTQAIAITDGYLEDYLNIINQMHSSIERIIKKSKFVFGEIVFDK